MTGSSRIFISYARADERIARAIFDRLSDAGLEPWLDLREMSLGDSIAGGIDEALGDASYLLLLVSRASMSSKWVDREWKAALASPGTVIVPVLLDDTTPPNLLRDLLRADLRGDEEAGIEELVKFFAKETETGRRVPFRGEEGTRVLRKMSRRQLRLVALHCIDEVALQAFCFDAAIDPRSLHGTSVHEKVLSLLHLAGREDLLASFAEWLELEHARCVAARLRELDEISDWKLGEAAS